MATPSLGLAIESEVRLSPEERAASWADFSGLVTAPNSNRTVWSTDEPPLPLHYRTCQRRVMCGLR